MEHETNQRTYNFYVTVKSRKKMMIYCKHQMALNGQWTTGPNLDENVSNRSTDEFHQREYEICRIVASSRDIFLSYQWKHGS